MFALALAGALAAFLRFNLPPAKIYLGDAGSMTIGLMISALSVRACSDGPGTAVSLLPVIALLIVAAAGHRDRGRPALAQAAARSSRPTADTSTIA